MTQSEFEERMEEVKASFGIPDDLGFKMDAEFKIDEDAANVPAERLSLMKTAAASEFFAGAVDTNTEKDMQVLEAGILDKGNYMYIVSSLMGVPSIQMIRSVFYDKDGNEIEVADTEAEDFILGKLKKAFAKAAGKDGAPNILMRRADVGEPYELVNKNGGNDEDNNVFMDFAVQNLGKMSEKERYIAEHINSLFAEDSNVPPERCFVIEVKNKDEAIKKLKEYVTAEGLEYIDNTYNLKDGRKDENDFVYGKDGKNFLVNFAVGDEKRINLEPYESLDGALTEIVKSID